MKGIILAGGTGSRLGSLTKVTNKHLLPVGDQPMIFHPIAKLTEAGIRDILIVTGIEHMGDIVRCLGSGKDFNCTFTYKVQDHAGGIAEALMLARGFAYGERMCVLLGDNIFEDSISGFVREYSEQDRGARVVLKRVDDPSRFGVAYVDGNKITKIIEKPANVSVDVDHYAVTGIYFYDQRVFGIIDKLNPSARGELEITDVNMTYLQWGELQYSTMGGWWTDAGTHKSLAVANSLVTAAR